MGYGTIRTLSDTSVRNCKGDIRELKPTILVGVPQVWETVKKGIVSKVEAGGSLTSKLFWGAMAAKGFLLGSGLPGSGILDTVVFNKVKDATGGRLRICMNGGGPIAKETQRFISLAITPMISGYGLTETTAMGALMDPMAWTDSALGEMPACIEMKLVDFADAGYFSTNNPPQGEIWIRGGGVTSGYLDLEEETKEAFTDDGWFKTGDVGEFDSKGQIKIIDRKKNLVKTLAGEYIALEKLESIYRSAPIVANICVYAAPDQMKPIAIIVPAEPALKKLAEENGVKGDHLEELVHDEKLNNAVLKQLQSAGTKGGLASFEIIAGVVLADEEWLPQNVSDPSTPAMHSRTQANSNTGNDYRCPKAQPKRHPEQVQEGSRPRLRQDLNPSSLPYPIYLPSIFTKMVSGGAISAFAGVGSLCRCSFQSMSSKNGSFLVGGIHDWETICILPGGCLRGEARRGKAVDLFAWDCDNTHCSFVIACSLDSSHC